MVAEDVAHALEVRHHWKQCTMNAEVLL